MEWEYHIVLCDQFYSWDRQALDSSLAEHGSRGWELVTVDRPDTTRTPLFIFKRPKGGAS